MHALITNDDGIDSEGIHVLARFVEQAGFDVTVIAPSYNCLLYTSPSPRDRQKSRMPSSA